MSTKTKAAARRRRHERLRRTVRGTPAQPRMVVYRSNAQIYVQVVDDTAGHTLVAASSLEKDVEPDGDGKTGLAKAVGKLVAGRAKKAGIDRVVFDRGGNRFQGRVAALAEGAREAGLEF